MYHTCHHYSLYVLCFLLCSPLCKMLDVKVLEEEDSVLAHGFRRVSPSQEGWQSRTEQSTSWQSGNRERCMQKRATPKMSARDVVTFSNWNSPPAFYTFSKIIGYYEGLTTSNNHSPIALLPPGSTLREVQKCTHEIA